MYLNSSSIDPVIICCCYGNNNIGTSVYVERLAHCLWPLNFKLRPVGGGVIAGWVATGYSPVLILKNLELVWVELLSFVSPVLRGSFFGFSSLPPSVKSIPKPISCDPWLVVGWRLPKAPSICLSTWPRWSASFAIQPLAESMDD